MSRILCVAVAMAVLSGPAMAGMSEGVAAVTVGDYERAISEFKPLAAGGDPAAQYQLARIYLEGRGPADGVAQGVDLMTRAANGGHPEAQAQLGLMYAMGLGVDPDNVQAYQWLSKAVSALPEGTRRTVAEANRDAVIKRLNAAEQTKVAASKPKAAEKPAATTAATTPATMAAKPAATQEAAKKPAAEAAAKATTAPATTAAKATTAPATTKAVTEAAATNKIATSAAKAPETKAKEAATTAKPAATTTGADSKAPGKSTQVASAKAPEASADAKKAMPSGVRIQLISMPSEDAAWAAWKQLSGKYASQLSGLTAIVEPADLGDKGMFYRVQTGPFTNVAAAQERCGAMKEAGLDCLVVGKP